MTAATFENSSLRLALIAVLGAGFGAAGCRSAAAEAKKTSEEPAVRVETVAAAERALPRFLTLTGTLEANQKAQVAANAAGKIERTYVERGSYVPRGMPLAIVDSRALALSQSGASAEVRALEAQSALAATECARAEKLFRDGTVSRAEYDRRGTDCKVAQWSKQAASARAGLAQRALVDSVVRAPFAGIVVERFVTAGEYVHPDTRIVTLVDIDQLRLQLTVQESAVTAVHEGQTVSFRVATFGDEEFPAEIKHIGPALRQASRDLVVEAILDNADRKLRPGMFATARVELGTYNAAVVPKTALREEGSTHHVFVVKEKRLEERVVETGDKIGDQVAIVRGIAPSERVVTSGGGDLRDGLRVE